MGTVRGEEAYGWSIAEQMSQSIATIRDIAVLATVFVDLEYVQQQPHFADWLDRAQRTVSQSLHVVPYYIEKAPSFGDSESVMSTPGLYQARQWRKSQVLDGVSAAMARGRWQISIRNSQRALSQLVSMVELPCRFFMVCGYLILPAAWCLLQWVVPSGWVAPMGIAALLTTGSWLEHATRRRRDTTLVPRVGSPLERRLPSLFALAATFLGCHRLGFDVTCVAVLSSWLVAMLMDTLGDSLTRLSVCEAWCDQLYERLVERGRMKPFLDRVHLQENSWRSVLAESLNRCGVFVCILTGRSNRSWVRRELSCAIRLAVV